MRGMVVMLMLALASSTLAGAVRWTTYEEKTLQRLHTVCSDGTRAVSTWNATLERWDTAVTSPTPPRRDTRPRAADPVSPLK
jgi:hypothetical protein